MFPMDQPPYYLQLIHNVITKSLMNQLELLLIVFFSFRGLFADKALVGSRD